MNAMPKKLRADCASDPFYARCARKDALNDHECQRDPVRMRMIEWEHPLYLAGKELQIKEAIVPLCWYTHRGPGQKKEIAIWIALNRMSEEQITWLSSFGGRDYFHYRNYLNAKYGVYNSVDIPVYILGNSLGIAY
jgi:hypothetical protein